MPRISVLIPIYNVEDYLEECLWSLRRQSFGDFEALCINDGSTDSSRAIIERFCGEDRRFRLVDKPNSGYGASMNRGLAEAAGELIAILESDDIMYPMALGELTGALDGHGAEVAKGSFTFYWSQDGGRDAPWDGIPSDLCDRLVDTRIDTRIFRQKASIWSGLYRRDFLDGHDIRFQESPGASFQDTSFAFKVWSCADAATFIERPIIHYRQDREASSVNSTGKAYAICGEYAHLERWLGERPADGHTDTLWTEFQVSRLNAYLWNLDRLDAGLRVGFAERAAQEFARSRKDGTLDLSRLDGWKRLNLERLMADPAGYVAVRNRSTDAGTADKFRFCLRLGGLPALVEVLRARRGA